MKNNRSLSFLQKNFFFYIRIIIISFFCPHRIKEPVRVREAFPILKEIAYRIDAMGRAIGYIVNALLHLTLDVPMVRRVPIDRAE